MAARSLWQRFRGLDFNFEQFRSELADETQIAEALPEGARADYLLNRAREEQGEAPAAAQTAPEPEAAQTAPDQTEPD